MIKYLHLSIFLLWSASYIAYGTPYFLEELEKMLTLKNTKSNNCYILSNCSNNEEYFLLSIIDSRYNSFLSDFERKFINRYKCIRLPQEVVSLNTRYYYLVDGVGNYWKVCITAFSNHTTKVSAELFRDTPTIPGNVFAARDFCLSLNDTEKIKYRDIIRNFFNLSENQIANVYRGI
jgi:hypothetical protein